MISHCSFLSNILFLCFIWRSVAQTVNKFGLFTIQADDLLPQLRDGEWLNCSPRCFDSNHNLPEFRYPVAIFSLSHCSCVLSGKMINKVGLLTIGAFFFDLLPQFTFIFGSYSLLLIFIWRIFARTTVNNSVC